MKRWFQIGAVLACSASAAASAEAQAPSGRVLDWLDWDAPAGCPERAAVYARTREAAGFPPESGRFQRVRAVIVPAEQGFVLTLEFFEARAQRSRSIEARNCSDLEGAAAVAIALALGTAEPSVSAVPEASARDVTVAASAQVPAAPARFGWAWSASGLLDLQSVSQASWGVAASAKLRWDALELGLFGLWLPPAQQAIGAGESVRFGLVAAGPLACWRWHVPLAPAACGAFEAGQLRADGSGLSRNPRQFSSAWLAPSLAVELQQPLLRVVGLQLRAEVLRPLVRERYTVNGEQRVYDSPEAVLRLYLGLGGSLD